MPLELSLVDLQTLSSNCFLLFLVGFSVSILIKFVYKVFTFLL